jgi:predicted membrane channel-forming protein YqfA (hemolysin III family)
VAVVCTAAAALLGVAQVVGTVLTRRWYPFNQAGEWTAMLLVWLVHAACFAALMLRRRTSRPLSATLAFGWAALLGVQVAEHFRNGSPDATGLLIVVALMAALLLFGFYLVSSSKAKSFLGD